MNWHDVYRDNAPKLLGVCRRYVRDEQKAEDVLHDGFVKAMEKFHTYNGNGVFEGWLRKIVVNTALEFLRKGKVEQVGLNEETMGNLSESQTQDNSPKGKVLEAGITQAELLEVIDNLPEHHKAVFNMYVLDDFKHKEIADLLEISPGTSKSHLARARKTVQKELMAMATTPEEKRKRKRALFAWWLLPGTGVDSLYKKGFSDYEITPSRSLQGENMMSELGTVNLGGAGGSTTFVIGGVGKVLVASVAVLGIGFAVWKSQEEGTKENQVSVEVLPQSNTSNISTLPKNESLQDVGVSESAQSESISSSADAVSEEAVSQSIDVTNEESAPNSEGLSNNTSYPEDTLDPVVVHQPVKVMKKVFVKKK